jgi:hypothetical protein
MNDSLGLSCASPSAAGFLIVAARPEDVAPNETVPAEEVPVGLVLSEGYVARRLFPFSKPPSIGTRPLH